MTGIQSHDHFPGSDTMMSPESKIPLAMSWHGREMNDHNYAEVLTKDKAVFRFQQLPAGDMAKIYFDKGPHNQPKQPPRGRARAGKGFFEEGVVFDQ